MADDPSAGAVAGAQVSVPSPTQRKRRASFSVASAIGNIFNCAKQPPVGWIGRDKQKGANGLCDPRLVRSKRGLVRIQVNTVYYSL
jgi:hypothetical protein